MLILIFKNWISEHMQAKTFQNLNLNKDQVSLRNYEEMSRNYIYMFHIDPIPLPPNDKLLQSCSNL